MKKVIDICRKNLAWLLLLITAFFFSMSNSNFFSLTNIFNILNQNAYIIITACGYAMLMISGDIDLAVGYQMSICGVVCSIMLTTTSLPIGIIVIITIALSIVLSMAGTFLAQILDIPRMYVTLALSTLFQGVAYVITESKTISGFPVEFKAIGQATVFHPNLTYATLLMVICCIVISFVLSDTYFGRHVFALGGNAKVARLSGVDVKKVRYVIGALAGFFNGLGAIVLIARIGSANASIAFGTEFTALTGVLLGGVSIRGGEGKMGTCVAGILLLGLLSNGMQLAGWNVYYQYIVKGAIMLFVIGFDTIQIRKRNIVSSNINND